jgi:serine-type D-Ala-D-Ala carboxypeptidase/endopeptidase (penicillin-binding protein 4)
MSSRPRPLLSWFAVVLAACAAPGAGARQANELASALRELCATPALRGGRIGVHVVDPGSGTTLLEHAARSGFATASNLKLLSAAVALTTLGPGFRFTTALHARGHIDAGVLHGDLVIVGGGDPSFGTGGDASVFTPWIAALRERGVQRVTGRVVGDDALLGSEHLGLGWQWDYLHESYAAPFGGLCFGDNLARYRVELVGDAVRVQAVPPADEPALVEVRTVPVGSEAELVAQRELGGERVVLRGGIPVDAKPRVVTVTVRDPAAHAAAALRAALRAAGIVVEGAEPTLGAATALLVEHASAPLGELLVPVLRDSDNLHAEQLLRVAARRMSGDGGTAAAERHAKATLVGLGVDVTGMVLADGSGLSRRNLVQPQQLTTLLSAIERHRDGAVFVAALPLAGRSGTLRNRMVDGPAAAGVRAKTGFISRVVCLSGFVPRADPTARPWVFSVMLNDFTADDSAAKAAVDRFVQRLAGAARG